MNPPSPQTTTEVPDSLIEALMGSDDVARAVSEIRAADTNDVLDEAVSDLIRAALPSIESEVRSSVLKEVQERLEAEADRRRDKAKGASLAAAEEWETFAVVVENVTHEVLAALSDQPLGGDADDREGALRVPAGPPASDARRHVAKGTSGSPGVPLEVSEPKWFEANEHGRLEELRNGDEPGRGIVLLTPLEPQHLLALLGSIRDRDEDDDLPVARQLLMAALVEHQRAGYPESPHSRADLEGRHIAESRADLKAERECLVAQRLDGDPSVRERIREIDNTIATLDQRECQVPPKGWRCSREPGHDGPCAATPEPQQPPVSRCYGHKKMQRVEWAPTEGEVYDCPGCDDCQPPVSQSEAVGDGGEALTPDEARAAVLAGQTVRIVVGSDPQDPICLHYLDRCEENDHEPMIYSEAIAGWSGGVKEAICEPDSDFYVGFVADPPPLSISVTDEAPIGRESPEPVVVTQPNTPSSPETDGEER